MNDETITALCWLTLAAYLIYLASVIASHTL